MNAQIALARMPSRTIDPPEFLSAALRPDIWMPAASRTVYGKRRRVDPLAATASLTLVACAFGSFLFIGRAPAHRVEQRLTLIEVANLQPPPPPPPPAPSVKPAPRAAPVDLVDAPPPVIAPPPSTTTLTVADIPPAPIERDGPDVAPAPARPASGPTNAGDLSATMVSATPPRYPIESRRLREQGIVTLSVMLGLDGSVADVSIAKSSGFVRLDRAALGAVRHWRWSPMVRNGNPVLVKGLVTIPFVLRT